MIHYNRFNTTDDHAYNLFNAINYCRDNGEDGIIFDCEPQYCGAEYCSRLRTRIQETNRNLVYLSENVNTRENAFDSELYGVMNILAR